MRITWDERKRNTNLRDHGFDFADARRVFEGFTVTYEDDRFPYSERRFVTLGLLNEIAVSIVHLESREHIHVISFRRATKHEEIFLFKNL